MTKFILLAATVASRRVPSESNDSRTHSTSHATPNPIHIV